LEEEKVDLDIESLETRAANEQDSSAQELHLLDLLILLSERRKLIFWFTLGAAIVSAIAVLLVPNRYTAETVVLPPGQNSSMSSALLSQVGGGAFAALAGGSLGIKNTGEMYVSLFRGRAIEDALIQRFGLMQRYRTKTLTDARRKFEHNSTVVLGTKDGLIRISVTDRDPKLAADIANAYVEEFRKLSASLAISEASQRRVFFQQQLLEANQDLVAAEEAMKHTEQSTGILQIDSQARSLIESAAILRGQIAAQEVELQGMSSYATEKNPQVVVAEQQLAALKAQLAKLSGTDANPGSDIVVPKGNIPEAGIEYIRKLRDVKYYETISELIAKQYEMAKLDEAREGAIIQVSDVAVPPDKKSSPYRALVVVLTTLIAFVTSVLWVLARARWRQVLSDPVQSGKFQTLRNLYFNRAAAGLDE
jgi:tyrosine-protein kinase Etk/Wzc